MSSTIKSTPCSGIVIGHMRCIPLHITSTILCGGITPDKSIIQRSVLLRRQDDPIRGFDHETGDGSSDSSEDSNDGKDEREVHSSHVSLHHSSSPQHALPSNPRHTSLSTAGSTSLTTQTSAGASLVGSQHSQGKVREATAKPTAIGMSILPTKFSATYASKKDYLTGDSLTEKGPILLDVPDGRNELVMAANSTQSVPKLYPIVGFRKQIPGIALPPPIPLDLSKLKTRKIASNQQVIREQPNKTGTVPGVVSSSNVNKPPLITSSYQQHQQAPQRQSMDFSDPVSIISAAAVFLHAGDYGTMLRILEILDKHLVLPEDIDMAKEFGQGLANYKNLHYRAAKPCFNALFDKLW